MDFDYLNPQQPQQPSKPPLPPRVELEDPLSPLSITREDNKQKLGIAKQGNDFGASRPDHTHEGIDIPGNIGDIITSPADGEVTFAGWQKGYGKVVYLKHPDGTTTRYGHLSNFKVEVGDRIKQGVPIGLVGQTGNAHGPHLHYERRDANNQPIDPLLQDYFPTVGGKDYDPLSPDSLAAEGPKPLAIPAEAGEQQEQGQEDQEEEDPLSPQALAKESQDRINSTVTPLDEAPSPLQIQAEAGEQTPPAKPIGGIVTYSPYGNTLSQTPQDLASYKLISGDSLNPFKRYQATISVSPDDDEKSLMQKGLEAFAYGAGLRGENLAKAVSEMQAHQKDVGNTEAKYTGTNTTIDKPSLTNLIKEGYTTFSVDDPYLLNILNQHIANGETGEALGLTKEQMQRRQAIIGALRNLNNTPNFVGDEPFYQAKDPRSMIEGMGSAGAGTLVQAGNLLNLINKTNPAEWSGFHTNFYDDLVSFARQTQQAIQQSESQNPNQDVMGGFTRGLGSAVIELPKLMVTKGLGEAQLPTLALLSEYDRPENLPSALAESGVMAAGMPLTSELLPPGFVGQAGQVALWTGIPTIQGMQSGKPFGQALGESIPFGVISGLHSKKMDDFLSLNLGPGDTIAHSNPAIDGKQIALVTQYGKAIVDNPANKQGISVVKPQAAKQDRVSDLLEQVNEAGENGDKTKQIATILQTTPDKVAGELEQAQRALDSPNKSKLENGDKVSVVPVTDGSYRTIIEKPNGSLSIENFKTQAEAEARKAELEGKPTTPEATEVARINEELAKPEPTKTLQQTYPVPITDQASFTNALRSARDQAQATKLTDEHIDAAAVLADAAADSWVKRNNIGKTINLVSKEDWYKQIAAIEGSGEVPDPALWEEAWHGSPYEFETSYQIEIPKELASLIPYSVVNKRELATIQQMAQDRGFEPLKYTEIPAKFDINKIGTGEGAQVYGWGLYFAGRRGVAEYYKRNLSNRDDASAYHPASNTRLDNPVEILQAYLRPGREIPDYGTVVEFDQNPENWFRWTLKYKTASGEERTDTIVPREWWNDTLTKNEIRARLSEEGWQFHSGGKLYKVDLTPAQEDYLLWDEPFDKQSQKVQDALRRSLIGKIPGESIKVFQNLQSDLLTQLHQVEMELRNAKTILPDNRRENIDSAITRAWEKTNLATDYKDLISARNILADATKQDTDLFEGGDNIGLQRKAPMLVRELLTYFNRVDLNSFNNEGQNIKSVRTTDISDSNNRNTGSDMYDLLKQAINPNDNGYGYSRSDREASLHLLDLGVRGIKYLNGVSRGSREGIDYLVKGDQKIKVNPTRGTNDFYSVMQALEEAHNKTFGEYPTTTASEGNNAYREKIVSRLIDEGGWKRVTEQPKENYNYVIFNDKDINIKQILDQQGRGAVSFAKDGRATIHILQDADSSTPVHELAHIFRKQLSPEDQLIATRWANAKDNLNWDRDAEEKFATGFERYLREGKAPTPQLTSVFQQFKDWLKAIYTKIKGSPIDTKLTPAARAMFGRILGSGAEEGATPTDNTVTSVPSSSTERLEENGEGRVAPSNLAPGQQEQADSYKQTLSNPELVDRAEYVPSWFGTEIAIPVGGARRWGILDGGYESELEAQQVVQQLSNRPDAFPNARVIGPKEYNGKKYWGVEWGETPPEGSSDLVKGQYLGYSKPQLPQPSIQQQGNQWVVTQPTPSGQATYQVSSQQEAIDIANNLTQHGSPVAPAPEDQPIQEQVNNYLSTLAKYDSNQGGFLGLPSLNQISNFFAKLRDRTISGLNLLKNESLPAYEAARSLANSAERARLALGRQVPAIEQAYGKPIGLFFQHLVESNLQGAENRYLGNAAAVRNAQPGKFLDVYRNNHLADILDNISGVKGVAKDIVEQVNTALSNGLEDDAKNLTESALMQAASTVTHIESPQDLQAAMQDPRFNAALSIYKQNLETPLNKAQALQKSPFLQDYGPLNTYFPLAAIDPTTQEVMKGYGSAGSDFNLAKAYNPSAQFRTGRADDYSTDIKPFVDSFISAVRRGDRAQFVDLLKQLGIAAPYKGGQTPILDDHVLIRGGRRYYTDQGIVEEKVQIPRELAKEIKPLVDRDPLDKLPEHGVRALLNSIVDYSLRGLLEPSIHGANIDRNLVTRTPFIFKDVLTKAVDPQTRTMRAVLKTIDTIPNILLNIPTSPIPGVNPKALAGYLAIAKPELMQEGGGRGSTEWNNDVELLGKAGALPTKIGRITYNPEFARVTGAKVTSRFNLGPALFGENGMDISGRVVALRVLKQMKRDAGLPPPTITEIADFVDNLGIYNKSLEGDMVRIAKQSGLGPFATAGVTRIRNGVNAWLDPLGSQNLPSNTPASYHIAQLLSGSAYGTLAMWAITYKAYTGKYPWKDPKARLLQIPLNNDDRKSKAGQLIYGPGNDTAYVSMEGGSQVGSGMRALGLAGFFDTLKEGGSYGQAAEKGLAQSLTTTVQPLVSSPVLRAGITTIGGVQPALSGMRDTITGRYGPQFYPAVTKQPPGLKQFKENAIEGVLSINGFLHNILGSAGVTYEPQYVDKLPTSSKFIQMILNLASPGLIKGTRDNDKIQQSLEKAQKAAERPEKK